MQPATTFESMIGLIGIVTFIVALIMFMDLVSNAFKRDKGPKGLLIGLQALFFPIGTYHYCKQDWETYGKKFKLICILLGIGFVSILISKLL